jgi:hypothetical protein
MSLDLSPEIENVVRERAAAAGVSVNDLLARTFVQEKVQTRPLIDPKEHVRALLAQWQTQDNTPILPPIPIHYGETPTQALFRKWEDEDADMSKEEQEREERLWEEVQQSINSERTKTGMRTLF